MRKRQMPMSQLSSLSRPAAESEVTATMVPFHSCKALPTCSKCGAMKAGSKECENCKQKRSPQNRGVFTGGKHPILEELEFPEFWKLHQKELSSKFKFHHFKHISLSKACTTDVRRRSLQQGEVSIGHDFTEALCIVHNEEIQSNHFGGGVRVSIEGYTVHYPSFMDGSSLVFDFHSFLGDDTTQMTSTVHCHMIKLINQLMKNNILHRGGRLSSTAD